MRNAEKMKVFAGGFGSELVKGWELWLSGEAERAVSTWREGAAKDDPFCVDKMTWAYDAGVGVERSIEEASVWAQKGRKFCAFPERTHKRKVRVYFGSRTAGYRRFYFEGMARRTHKLQESADPEVFIFSVAFCGASEDGTYLMSQPDHQICCPRFFWTGEALDVDNSLCEWSVSHVPDYELQEASALYWPYAGVTTNTLEVSPFFEPESRVVPAVRLASQKPEFAISFISHDTTLRTSIIKSLSEYRPVTVCGESKLSNRECPPRLKNRGIFKPVDLVETSKFMLALENVQRRGYITEKLPEALMTGSVPIYWGAPDVEEYFNPKAFINASTMTIDELRECVIELDNDDAKYNAMTAEHPFKDGKPPLWFGMGRLMRRYSEIFGHPYYKKSDYA